MIVRRTLAWALLIATIVTIAGYLPHILERAFR